MVWDNPYITTAKVLLVHAERNGICVALYGNTLTYNLGLKNKEIFWMASVDIHVDNLVRPYNLNKRKLIVSD